MANDTSTTFVWKGTPLPTVGQLLDAVCAIESAEEATEFMSAYRAVNEHADGNVGYLIGYLEPADRRRQVYELFGLSHPIFGGQP